jgi:hypothetical protein
LRDGHVRRDLARRFMQERCYFFPATGSGYLVA